MKKNFKLSIALTNFIMLFSLTLYGCGGATSKNEQSKKNTTTEQKISKTEEAQNQTPGNSAVESKISPQTQGQNQGTANDLHERAQKVANAVKAVDGIKDATVVITEKRALVGVNIGNNVEGNLTDKIKSSVETKVKATDKEIETVAVSADPDLFTRISKVGQGIQAGKPLSEFGNEIKEIFNRVVPK
ncbi:YhcN/YlaJ family sporulation lipoprotein [Clostridium pascui]|nr:YhcN/YlaJ family sporulation lipoprotein [Clostridium pascui]MBM7869441.1 YhcN/YlaJ family sporulation lipoprotein [Clostridium pascui]